jgi:hypothetical protein
MSLLDRRIIALENGDPDPMEEDLAGLSPDEEDMTDDMVDLIVKSAPLKAKAQRETFVDPNDLNIKRIRCSEPLVKKSQVDSVNG